VEIQRYGDPEFAIDGSTLTADVRNPLTNQTCRGCRRFDRLHENDDKEIIEKDNTLEERCYTDGGSKNGADYLGGSFYFICDKPQDMCVCALRRDGRLEDDVSKHGRERACYGVSRNGTWGGAAANIVTKCRREGECENFLVAADNLALSNGARTYRGNDNTAEFSFENDHYLHAPRLAVGCRGCEEIEKRLECRERNFRRDFDED
jgi:hypothetical protein